MEAFWDHLSAKFVKKCDFNVGEFNCMIWNGAKYVSGYGKCYIKWVDGETSFEKAHRVAFVLKLKKTKVEFNNWMEQSEQKLECSHTCGRKLCVNVEHLVVEPHFVNMERNHCFAQGSCTGLHSPHCL